MAIVGLSSLAIFGGHPPSSHVESSFASASTSELSVRGIRKLVKRLNRWRGSKGVRGEVMGPHYRVAVGLGGCPVRVKPPIILSGRSVIVASAAASVEGCEG
ncbi:hypothetical protein B296_00024915 [Ensete ventricosum]|uniref:Uncharacterized protein n=1 Tax=Ensete ventricosum TaxID=4639 RepID=A0A427A7C5_ENSVE|nr:hypothetical protein B296_00024915 [Ensete ventricosum]